MTAYEIHLPDTIKAAVDAYATSRGITFADAVRDILAERLAPAPSTATLAERIRDAYDRLASRPRAWVSLVDLRAALADVGHDTLTRALKDLHIDGPAQLIPEENRRSLTPADRAAAVIIGDEPRHLISYDH